MSALEVFVRIRQYKDRAAEFFELAAQPFSEEVRARYLAIADHYMALADAEIRADKLIRQKRLDHMRAEREIPPRASVAPDADVEAEPPPRPADAGQASPGQASPSQQRKRPPARANAGPAQMAAQADFTIVKPAR
jgi:hypothetical protein